MVLTLSSVKLFLFKEISTKSILTISSKLVKPMLSKLIESQLIEVNVDKLDNVRHNPEILLSKFLNSTWLKSNFFKLFNWVRLL